MINMKVANRIISLNYLKGLFIKMIKFDQKLYTHQGKNLNLKKITDG